VGRGLVIVLVGLSLGCARPAPPARVAAATDSGGVRSQPAAADAGLAAEHADASAPRSLAATGAAPPIARPHNKCNEIVDAWRTLMAAGGRCTGDADCVCHTSSLEIPGDEDATDVATARAAAKLERAFGKLRCPTGCADRMPTVCRPKCQDGRCLAEKQSALDQLKRRRSR
jgi:hypothetical protein